MRRTPERQAISPTSALQNSNTSPLTELIVRIKEDARLAESHLHQSLKHALAAGESLCHAKKIVPHGGWNSWLVDSQFAFCTRTAQRYMRLYRKWCANPSEITDSKTTSVSQLSMSAVLDAHTRRIEREQRPTNDFDGPESEEPNRPKQLEDFSDQSAFVACNNEIGDGGCQTGLSLLNPVATDPESGTIARLDSELCASTELDPSSSFSEWLTPDYLVEAVSTVLGVIDLDPAADAGKRIPADRHYTVREDGLAPESNWSGKIFLCPPTGHGEIKRFAQRLSREYDRKNVDEAILLVPSRTDQDWFRQFRSCMRCFISPPSLGAALPTTEPLVAIYLGDRTTRFYNEFETQGDCYVPVCAKHIQRFVQQNPNVHSTNSVGI